MLVVVEDGDVQLLAQPLLDIEAPRRRDVLEIDTAVDGRDGLDDRDDLLGVLRVEAHRPGVDVAEALEESGLAFHDGQSRLRADVAQAEHRGAVGDDGHGVAFDRVLSGEGAVARDLLAHARHARRVDPGEILARAQRVLQIH